MVLLPAGRTASGAPCATVHVSVQGVLLGDEEEAISGGSGKNGRDDGGEDGVNSTGRGTSGYHCGSPGSHTEEDEDDTSAGNGKNGRLSEDEDDEANGDGKKGRFVDEKSEYDSTGAGGIVGMPIDDAMEDEASSIGSATAGTHTEDSALPVDDDDMAGMASGNKGRTYRSHHVCSVTFP